MKQILSVSFCLLLAGVSVAKTPPTRAPVLRPMTDVSVQRPQTDVQVVRPVSSGVQHLTTQVQVVRPQTQVEISHPQTTTQVTHPTTTVEVVHPTTQVEVVHPQTTVEVIHPQTPGVGVQEDDKAGTSGKPDTKKGGKTVPTVKATSMSDYTPKQAKDFKTAQKAAALGGGDLKLGNSTDQAAKDAAAKASLLGSQNNQNMDVNPKQNKVSGLDKVVTDRAKQRGKRK